MYIYGLLNLSFWGYVVALLILTQITIVSVTLYLHRCQAHRSLELHPIASHFFRLWLWLTTGMITKEWTAVHRKHHAKCETAEDPHSPQVYGIKKLLLEGTELYQAATDIKEDMNHYGHGTPDDWMERHIYTPYNKLGIAIMAVIDLILFGIPGISIWGLQMMWIPFFAAGVINGIGHYWGYRNYETPDAARNIIPVGFFLGGEELHNNHHAFGSSAKFSHKWWEIDLGWFYIKLLKLFKLATVKKVAPTLVCIKNKTVIDTDTIKAIIISRFQIMSQYSSEVILPVLKEEKRKAGEKGKELFARAKKLLIRDNDFIDPINKMYLTKLLNERRSLNMVYQYKQKLQEIWQRTSANQKELIDALQEWCKQAETAGIQALAQFAQHLKSFKAEYVQG